MSVTHDDEDDLVRAVAIQNAQSILVARQRAEEALVTAKEALEARSEELERANALIRTIAENAASGLLMLDEQGIATYMNAAAMRETGYRLEEFSKAPFHHILHAPGGKNRHSADACPIRNARETMQRLRNHRDFFVRKNGTSFPVSCSLSPLEQEGRQAGAVLEFRDITDELRAQKSLEDSNQRKDEFLATLSHELRTPMTAVLGWARMLRHGLPEIQAREAIEAIEKSAEIQAQLIEDVLDISRIVSGKMTFRPAPVDLGPVIRAAITTVHPASVAKGIEVLSSIPPALPKILGDEGRLQQIVWNLLSNSVKFTPRGGRITVRLTPAGSLVRLTVEDSGKGIDPVYLRHVFEPFSQEDGSMTRSYEGLGLGLSIVRSLVELHGGTIRASSEGTGKGSVFTVEFPVIESSSLENATIVDPPRVTSKSISELPSLSGIRVLVIDDQAFSRDLVAAVFSRADAEVRTASSVREGLASFEAETPDVVVCDLAMPEEDGFAFLRSVRAGVGASSATPVIALTAFGRTEDRQLALESGFDAYLKKPVNPEELAATVRRLAASRS